MIDHDIQNMINLIVGWLFGWIDYIVGCYIVWKSNHD